MPALNRQVAQPTLDRLETELDPTEMAEARETAESMDLDALVSEALGVRVR
jgi:hypothetical protein